VIRSVAASDFTAEELLCGKEVQENGKRVRKPVTVYLRFPERRLLALSPLIRLFWSSLIDELVELYDARRGTGCHPVLMLIDEAGSAPVPALPEFAATVVGRGISLWAAFQDLNQARSIYGHDRARTLMNNMETQVFYRQAGLETSEYIEKRLGRKSEYAHSKTSHDGHEQSEGESETGVPLLTAQDISELDDTEIILLHRKLKPIRAKRTDWREYPELSDRTKIPPPLLSNLPKLPDLPPLPEEPDYPERFGP
jgi:type IV secretory pathway TraG/TraD family ATPase VirD4